MRWRFLGWKSGGRGVSGLVEGSRGGGGGGGNVGGGWAGRGVEGGMGR